MNLNPPPPYASIEELTKWCNDLYEHIQFPIIRSCFTATGTQANMVAGTTYYPFTTESFDIGGDYDASGAQYVCPVDGIYFFILKARLQNIDSGATSYDIGIKVNSTTYLGEYDVSKFSADVVEWTITMTTGFIKCSKADVVRGLLLQTGGANQADIEATSLFSGFLLQRS